MTNLLDKRQVEDLLDYIGVTGFKGWKGDRCQFNCPIHGEKHPSCGINISYSPPDEYGVIKQVFNCFSCHASGDLLWFIFKSLPDEFKNVGQVVDFVKNRYNVDLTKDFDVETIGKISIMTYDEYYNREEIVRFETPRTKLAPFRSGKETYQYFFDRGFTKSDMREYMIGRDTEYETITIPAFWEDGKLAGIIGRYIDPNRRHNERFKIYDFPKGSLIYPLDKLEVIDSTIIGVESMLDVIPMRNWGLLNTCATLGSGMSKEQASQIKSRCHTFIDLFDNDAGGLIARDIAKKVLGKEIVYKVPTYYPNFGKDPSEWGEEETKKVIESAVSILQRKLPRL